MRERKTRYVPVRMTAIQGKHLDALAKQDGISVSEQLRTMIRREAQRRGLWNDKSEQK